MSDRIYFDPSKAYVGQRLKYTETENPNYYCVVRGFAHGVPWVEFPNNAQWPKETSAQGMREEWHRNRHDFLCIDKPTIAWAMRSYLIEGHEFSLEGALNV